MQANRVLQRQLLREQVQLSTARLQKLETEGSEAEAIREEQERLEQIQEALKNHTLDIGKPRTLQAETRLCVLEEQNGQRLLPPL